MATEITYEIHNFNNPCNIFGYIQKTKYKNRQIFTPHFLFSPLLSSGDWNPQAITFIFELLVYYFLQKAKFR
jgi:hypothetical protein